LAYNRSMSEVQKLLEKLNARGWTYIAIARALAVHKGTVHRWRLGQRQPENAFSVVLALQYLLDQPVPTRRYRRRKLRS
jgi:IS30 family transposase